MDASVFLCILSLLFYLCLLEILKAIHKNIIPRIAKASPGAVLVIITNPLDIMTYVALKISQFPASRVMGTGTLIDSGRFRALLAKEGNINPEEVHTYILGEHGDSQFPVVSLADVGGIRLKEKVKDRIADIFDNTKNGGQMVMQKKGYTNYAIALATSTLVECIVYDKRKIYPVSTLVDRECGVEDVCISIPCVIGRKGIVHRLELDMNDEEKEAFKNSAGLLKDIISSLEI